MVHRIFFKTCISQFPWGWHCRAINTAREVRARVTGISRKLWRSWPRWVPFLLVAFLLSPLSPLLLLEEVDVRQEVEHPLCGHEASVRNRVVSRKVALQMWCHHRTAVPDPTAPRLANSPGWSRCYNRGSVTDTQAHFLTDRERVLLPSW